MAMNRPLHGKILGVAAVAVLLMRMPVTPLLSPSTSSSVWFHSMRTLPCLALSISLSTRIFSARNLSRRCTTVTCLGDVGQVQRFLDRGVAAADHRHVLALVEEAVAGGAGRHALAHELLLGGQAEVLGRCAGGDDQRVAGVGGLVADQRERLVAELDRVDVVEHDLGVEALGVLLEALHQLRALHARRRRPASCPRRWWSSAGRPGRCR